MVGARVVTFERLDAHAFAPFGQVIGADLGPGRVVKLGTARRFDHAAWRSASRRPRAGRAMPSGARSPRCWAASPAMASAGACGTPSANRFVDFYNGQEVMAQVQTWYEEFGFFGVLVAAITPIPYKVFTIASGWFKFDFGLFVLASAIGCPFRFFLVAGLIGRYGERVRPFLETRLEWALVALTALAALGFAAIKLLG